MTLFVLTSLLVLLCSTDYSLAKVTCDNQAIGIESGGITKSQISASSVFSNANQASNGRLHYRYGESWCASKDDNKAYLQIDLGSVHVLCAIATQGNSKADQMVTSYTIKSSLDGKSWKDYKENGHVKNFVGNSDSNSVVKNCFNNGLAATHVRILPAKHFGASCLRLEIYGTTKAACIQSEVGIELPQGVSPQIADDKMTATSQREGFKPYFGRLNYGGGWAPRNRNDRKEYLQIDLGQPYIICAVGTQKISSFPIVIEAVVTTYRLSFSMNTKTWETYPRKGVLNGNQIHTADNKIAKNVIPEKKVARLIRFQPVTFIADKILRVGVYGVPQVTCDNQPLGIEAGLIKNSQMTSSSTLSDTTKARNGRLHYKHGEPWCASRDDDNAYLQIDLRSLNVVCAIATQGNSKTNQRVTSYTIKSSLDGVSWKDYKENGKIKKFVGNSDGSSVVKNHFMPKLEARFVRILPTTSVGASCLGVEFYGVTENVCTNSEVGIRVNKVIPDHRITSTSYYSLKYQPQFGRLNHDLGWATKSNGVENDYLQIDLGAPHIICAVGIQKYGKSSLKECVKTYKLSFSMNGKTWETYPKKDALIGNKLTTPHNTTKQNVLQEIKVAKFIRFIPKQFENHKTMRVGVYGTAQAWRGPMGLEFIEGNDEILDTQITASSNLGQRTYSRLYSKSSWCAEKTDEKPYLQFDLGSSKQVSGIGVQGAPYKRSYVKEFSLKYGYSTHKWTTIKNIKTNITGKRKVESVELNVYWFPSPIGARYIRIYPIRNHGGANCIRLDFYGNNNAFPTKILKYNTVGILQPRPGSFVTVHCVASGDNKVHINWLLGGKGVTDLSNGKTYDKEKTSSQLQVNFTSVSEVRSRYNCHKINDFLFKCKLRVTCQAKRKGAAGDRKDSDIEIEIELPKPTQKPVFTTKIKPSRKIIPTPKMKRPKHKLGKIDNGSNSSVTSKTWHLMVSVAIVVLASLMH